MFSTYDVHFTLILIFTWFIEHIQLAFFIKKTFDLFIQLSFYKNKAIQKFKHTKSKMNLFPFGSCFSFSISHIHKH